MKNRAVNFSKYCMPVSLVSASFVVAYAIGLVILPNRGDQSPPVRILNDAISRAGMQCAGASIDNEFVFDNVGSRTLRVVGVQTSCNCADYSIDPIDIPPGASCSLWLTTTLPANVNCETPVEIQADVFFDGFSYPLKVYVRASVVPETPSVVDFGRVLQNVIQIKKLFKIHSCDKPICVERVHSDEHFVAAKIVEPFADSVNDAVIEISFAPPPIPGEHIANLQLIFDDPLRDSSNVIARASVAPRIEALPDALLLGAVSPAASYSYSIKLHSTVNDPFDVVSIHSSVAGMTCTASSTNSANTEYCVQSVFTSPDVIGALSGNLEIYTTDKACPRVVIPVYGVCDTSNKNAHSQQRRISSVSP